MLNDDFESGLFTWPSQEQAAELSDEAKTSITKQGYNLEAAEKFNINIDLSGDMDDRDLQVTETELEMDKDWVQSSRELMPLFRGYVKGGEPDEEEFFLPEASDIESAQWGIELMGMFNWNIVDQTAMTHRMGNAPLKQRAAFYKLMHTYETLPNMTWDGSVRAVKGLVSDPTSIIGLGTFGAGFLARRAAMEAGKTGLKAYMRATLPAATLASIEGAGYGSLDDANRQFIDIDAGEQGEFSIQRNLLSTGVGAGAGLGLGLALPAAGSIAVKGVKKFGEALGNIKYDPSTLRIGVGPTDGPKDLDTPSITGDAREVRVTKAARLNSDERTLISQIATDGSYPVAAIEAEYRRVKEQFPASEGWENIVLNTEKGAKIKKGKNGKPDTYELSFKAIPYGYNRPKGQKKAPPVPDPKMVQKSSDTMVAEVVDLFNRAKGGDTAASKIIEQRQWYANMRERLRAEFGSMADVFADVIGATSAQTNVKQNWENSIEVMRLFTRGEYDEPLKRLGDWLDSGGTLGSGKADGVGYVDNHMRVREEAKAAGATHQEQFDAAQAVFPLITKGNGKLINANSPATMKALLDLFRVKEPGGSPKTYNFTGNLINYINLATIDVWAARYLRRISGGKRLPPPTEQGVGGEFGKLDTDPATGEFGFGQSVFTEAANKLRAQGIDLGDDDLQAVVWFMEKELWTRKGYTTRAGEGGSLDFEADVAGIMDRIGLAEARSKVDTDPSFAKREETKALINNPDEIAMIETRSARMEELQGFIDAKTPARRRDWVKKNFSIEDNDEARVIVKELREEVGKLNRDIKKRDALQPRLDKLTEKKETATAEGEAFIEANAAPVRRFTAGLSLDRPEKTATNEMMSESQGRLASTVEGDESVLMAKQTSGIGQYISPIAEKKLDANEAQLFEQLLGEGDLTNFKASVPSAKLVTNEDGSVALNIDKKDGDAFTNYLKNQSDLPANVKEEKFLQFLDEGVFDERAIDFEYVTRQDHNPADVVRQIVQEAKDTKQESAFFSEAVKPGTVEGANPGMEIYFNRKLEPDEVKELTKLIVKLEIDTGFTFTTDLRQADRQAAGAESKTYVGVRMQYIPEFGGGEQGRLTAIDAIMGGKEKLLKDLDYIANADIVEYDTEVFFRDKGDYDAELTGVLRSGRKAAWRR